MIVAAATQSFPDMPLGEVLSKLVDLEFTRAEFAIHERGGHIKPSNVLADLEKAVGMCRNPQRITPIAYSLEIDAEGDAYYEQFAACCGLAKATKVVTLVVPSAELGTPFNAEVERLRELVAIATAAGVVVGLRIEAGRMSQDADTIGVLCDNVKGLGVTLDPSHFIYGEMAGTSYHKLFKYVVHVHLRDTTRESFQVRVGQGSIDYGRIVNQLAQHKYGRALSVDIKPVPDVDHMAELRKIRLLLESLL